MEKTMKIIKKYWAIIVGAILAAFGIGIAVNKKLNDKQLAKSDKKIDDNKQQADVISGKVDAIEDQKTDIKKDIKALTADVKELEEKKQEVTTTTPKTAKQAKENILNKTNKKKKK
jgi:uncharacterized protein HemX